MRNDIRKRLEGLAEKKYQEFSASLIPGVTNMLGIRLPELRKLAKEIAKSDWKVAIAEPDYYFEERMLHGMVLNYVKGNIEDLLPYISEFIPLVDNWSVCDSVFMGMSVFQKDRERTWEYIVPYLFSDKEFEIRVAVIIMMQHLLKCDETGKKISRMRSVGMEQMTDVDEKQGIYLSRILNVLNEINTSEYYASMAVSWLVAEAFCCFPYHTYLFLKDNKLDDRTYNKGIQKIVESRIPSEEVKGELRAMKRR